MSEQEQVPGRHLGEVRAPEGTVCSRCGVVYHNQHWVVDEARRQRLLEAGSAPQVVCPGCRKVAGPCPRVV